MAGFEDRLLEDLGHEISDVIIAGEELLRSPPNEKDPLEFAREFRSLLSTLEVGCRLLQWDDFAFFLVEMGSLFDAATSLGEESASLRNKMQHTLAILTRVHESFDGVRFAPEQLSAWNEELHNVWTRGVAPVQSSENRREERVDIPEPSQATEELADLSQMHREELVAQKSSLESTAIPPKPMSDSTATFAVEWRGHQLHFPMNVVEGCIHLDPAEMQKCRVSDDEIHVRGSHYRWKKFDFVAKPKNPGVEKIIEGHEILLLASASGKQAFEVDRVLGIQFGAQDFSASAQFTKHLPTHLIKSL